MIILNVDYWSFRLSLVSSYIHYNISSINLFQYFKKQKCLTYYKKQLIESIKGYDQILKSTKQLEEYQTILKEKYNYETHLKKDLEITNSKLNDLESDKPGNKFDELKYFDDLEVYFKNIKTSNSLIEITRKQIQQCQRQIVKYNSALCESYISRLDLIKINRSIKNLAKTVDARYNQKSKLLFRFVSRFLKYFWFHDLHKIEI